MTGETLAKAKRLEARQERLREALRGLNERSRTDENNERLRGHHAAYGIAGVFFGTYNARNMSPSYDFLDEDFLVQWRDQLSAEIAREIEAIGKELESL